MLNSMFLLYSILFFDLFNFVLFTISYDFVGCVVFIRITHPDPLRRLAIQSQTRKDSNRAFFGDSIRNMAWCRPLYSYCHFDSFAEQKQQIIDILVCNNKLDPDSQSLHLPKQLSFEEMFSNIDTAHSEAVIGNPNVLHDCFACDPNRFPLVLFCDNGAGIKNGDYVDNAISFFKHAKIDLLRSINIPKLFIEHHQLVDTIYMFQTSITCRLNGIDTTSMKSFQEMMEAIRGKYLPNFFTR